MKKRTIVLLAILFFIVISGLLFIQLYWIRNAISITDQQFRNLANKALESVVLELEEKELVEYIIEDIDLASTDSVTAIIPSNSPLTKKIQGYHPDSKLLESYGLTSGRQPIAITSSGHKIFISEGSTQDFPGETSEPSPQAFSTEVSGRVSNKIVSLEKIMEKILRNPPDIRERIDPEELNQGIRNALNSVGIDLEYEFALRSATLGNLWKSPGFSDKAGTNKFIRQLFPNDPVTSQNQLVVYFLQEQQYKFEKIGSLGFISILFTLLLLVLSTGTFIVIFRQKKLSEIRTDFINNMTHELKTPISTISLASQMMSDRTISDEDKNIENLARVISDESMRLKFQVEKVLQMAIFEKMKMRLNLTACDLHAIADKALENHSLHLRKTGGTVTRDYMANPSVAQVDEIHFLNAMSNLIDNAIKYSGGNPSIKISTSNNRKGIVIIVEDNGIGISKDNLRRIFDKFYRASNVNADQPGTGLGLAIVKSIVENHQGRIWVDSTPEQGSTFTVVFPLAEDR